MSDEPELTAFTDDETASEPSPDHEETPVAAPRAAATTQATNNLSIVAMILSVIGCTFPVGLYLGYRSRNQIRRSKQYGDYFATVAIVVGWAYLAAVVVAVIAYVLLLVIK